MRIERDNQLPGEKDREIINYPGVGLRIERDYQQDLPGSGPTNSSDRERVREIINYPGVGLLTHSLERYNQSRIEPNDTNEHNKVISIITSLWCHTWRIQDGHNNHHNDIFTCATVAQNWLFGICAGFTKMHGASG